MGRLSDYINSDDANRKNIKINTAGGLKVITNNDYDKLEGVPIINIGSKVSKLPVILCGLDYGHYNVRGKYKSDSNDDVHTIETFLDVLVYEDVTTKHKIIQYFDARNDTIYLNTYVYEGSNRLKFSSIDLADRNISWGIFD